MKPFLDLKMLGSGSRRLQRIGKYHEILDDKKQNVERDMIER